ncbi:ankyrin repeat domain-containing protein [Modicisalibacter luteus]|uniref:ankyrin repeat domain-containing protein n=1 Tax=Modicisalibacter luteus TaxID=453962 RepID=UPI00363F8E92
MQSVNGPDSLLGTAVSLEDHYDEMNTTFHHGNYPEECRVASPQNAKPMPDEETIELATKLFNCARIGDTETFREWLPQGLPPNLCNQKGDSLVMLASYHGHMETTRVLLEYGADPEMRNDHGQNPLAGAAYKGNLPMVKLLLEHGAEVDGCSPDGKTALMFAAMFNHVDIVDFLLAHGANPQATESRGMTARDLALAMGAEDTAARLAG